MGNIVGIDLGTTYSVIAHVDEQGKAEVIRNENGKSITPSVVYFTPEGPIVGDRAKEAQSSGEVEVVSFFKRSMGDSYFLLSFYGLDYTPVDLSALVLGYLKRQAENYLGVGVTDAVITVPAYFTHAQRSATIDAGQKAGLHVLKVISEPTSAALAYGLRPTPHEQYVLVYDLGGGTFDVSLVFITATELNVIATDGDHQLGGKDWDDCLISYLATLFEQEFGIELLGDDINELQVQAELLKHALSARQSADIRVQASGYVGTYTVTRDKFEELTRHLMERTQSLTELVLTEAHLTWQAISGVLPVGGSTRMPMVRTFIEHLSGKPPMSGINPDEAVALGAAIQAVMEKESEEASKKPPKAQEAREVTETPIFKLSGRRQTNDVIAHSLGMIAENADRSRYLNSILIRKNQPIPSSQTRPYKMALRQRGDSQLEVFLTQGEFEDPQDCTYLGRYIFSGFPPVKGNIAILDITYEYDKNGLVHISAVERSSGRPLILQMEPLSPDVRERFAGVPSTVQVREHLTVYLAFDLSGSMAGKPLTEARKAARAFVTQCDLSNTSIGLIAFSDRVLVELAASQNVAQIERAIDDLRVGRTGYGNSGHPFTEIYNLLEPQPGIRHALVLADGVWSHQPVAIREAQRCHAAQIEVTAIGFGSANKKFLSQIASSSEQSLYTNLNKLTETFSTIAQELTESTSEKRGGKIIRRLL